MDWKWEEDVCLGRRLALVILIAPVASTVIPIKREVSRVYT